MKKNPGNSPVDEIQSRKDKTLFAYDFPIIASVLGVMMFLVKIGNFPDQIRTKT